MNKQRIAIVGGGIAGMVAANELQRSMPNADITLYERSKNLGGRASTIQKEGFYLNQGAHALYNSGALNKYLQQLGISLPGAPPPLNNSLAYIGGGFKKLPSGMVSLATTDLLSTLEKLALGWFLAELPRIDTKQLMDVPLRDWLQERFGQSTINKLIEALTRLGTYSHVPLMSAGAALEQLKLAQNGVRYLDHGWQNIVAALHDSLRRPIIQRLDWEVSSVQEVISDKGPCVIVTAGGDMEIFDSVILAVPPRTVQKIAPDVLPMNFSESLATAKIACFDVCLRALPNQNNTFVLGLDDPLYYSVHTASARLSDDGQVVIHMGYYLKQDEQGSQHHLNSMIDLLNKVQPGWEEQLLYKRFLPNMVASYATPLASTNGVAGLPTPQLPGASRIFAAGDWVGSGHFLADASAASAIAASRLVAATSSEVTATSMAA